MNRLQHMKITFISVILSDDTLSHYIYNFKEIVRKKIFHES